MQILARMRKLLVTVALAAACSSNPLVPPGGSDGGSDPCAGKSETDCKNAQGCVADYCFACSCTPAFAACRGVAAAPTMCPALGCAQPACGCEQFDATTCQSAGASMGCTAVFCPDCDGQLTNFAGCLGPNAGAPFCPPPSCPGRCRAQADCNGGEQCFAPGQPFGCPICMQPQNPCAGDAACGPGDICEVAPCTCDGTKSCTPGCATTGCAVGQVCGPANRCIPAPCSSCPPDFVCVAGGCERRTCAQDTDCFGRFCVNGACYGALGMCSFPPA